MAAPRKESHQRHTIQWKWRQRAGGVMHNFWGDWRDSNKTLICLPRLFSRCAFRVRQSLSCVNTQNTRPCIVEYTHIHTIRVHVRTRLQAKKRNFVSIHIHAANHPSNCSVSLSPHLVCSSLSFSLYLSSSPPHPHINSQN